MTPEGVAPTKAAQVLEALRDGPATTGELAAELGWRSHLTCAHLKELHVRGKITRKPFPTGNRTVRFIWSLVEAPEAAHAVT